MNTIKNLKCEYCTEPVGVDIPKPYFSWEVSGGGNPVYQEEYRIIVENKGILYWDTEFIKSGDSYNIEYSGPGLDNLNKYIWRVFIKTNKGEILESESTFFITGLIDNTKLTAKWIEHPAMHDNPVFYGDFYVKDNLASAYIVICGLGNYELTINDKRGHDTYNVPGWTDYAKRDLSGLLYPYDDKSEKRVLYNVYDIHDYIRKGINRYEVMLGNGFFNQVERIIEGDMSYGTPRLLLEIHMEYDDGTEMIICSNEETYCTDGPLEFNNIYFGEKRNDNIGLDYTGSITAMECIWEPGNLECQFDYFDRITEIIKPENPKGWLYDAGRNLAGRVRVKAKAPRGAGFGIAYFDAVDSDGNPDYRSTGGEWQIQENQYVFGSNDEIDYAETFGWRGFRYFSIEKDDDVEIYDISVEVISSDVRAEKTMETDNEIIKWIYDAYMNSQTSNMHCGVPSDCPHRERLGYTGDGQVTAEAALSALDSVNFYRKWNRDIVFSQNAETGFVPHTVPFSGGGGGPAWGSACAVVPRQIYNMTFDRRTVHDSYETLRKWIEYLEKKNPDLIIEHEEEGSWCLGDWCLPVEGYAVEEVDLKKIFAELDPALVNTSYFYYCVMTCVEFGKIISRDTIYYERLAARIKNKFNEKYLSKTSYLYSTGRHYANVYPLYFDMVPEEFKTPVTNALAGKIKKSGYAMDTGIFAASMIFKVLADAGRGDIISKMLQRKEFPSFGFMKDSGSKNLWETWDGRASLNHPMFGGLVSFFFKYLAGIRYIDKARRILIEPLFLETINNFSVKQNTLLGDISVKWERQNPVGTDKEKIILTISLPGNTRGAFKFGDSIVVLENGLNEVLVIGDTVEIKKAEK